MSDERTVASLNASELGVLAGIMKDSAAREALKRLEESGCEREDLLRRVNMAVTFRTLREGRSAKSEPWGLSSDALRHLPRGMRNLASQIELLHASGLGKLDHFRGALKEHPANRSLPPELGGLAEEMVRVVEVLPVILRWYADYLDVWRRSGKKHRAFLLRFVDEGMELALSSYVKNRTGSAQWDEISNLLTAAYDSATKGENLKGKKKAGDSAIHYEVENLRKRVARLNEEAAAIAGGQNAKAGPDKSARKKASGKSGTRRS